MTMNPRKLALAFASAALLTLAGCGGGGGGDITIPSGAGSSVTLSGIVATGAAFTDATITINDSTGGTVGTSSTPVGADGIYSITLPAGAVAPFVLTASRTNTDGSVESLVSVVPSTSGTTATVNITSVTNLIASRLSSSGDPLKLAGELAARTSIINATTVASKVDEVQAILGPILTATGTSSTNPLTGSFSVDGTGYDRLLDSIKVTIIVSGATTTNIEVAIKQQLAEGAAPNTIQFTSQTAAASIPVLAGIVPSTLVVSGTAALITQHLTQLNTCFALPLTTRITAGGTTAADIQAPDCKNAFFSNNPGTFLSNGRVVAKGKAFNGLFVDGGTGVVFSQGTYEFSRANGDIVIGYKSKNTAGSETFDTFALRLDTDGKLKQIGNQYAYPGGVSAYQQHRQFLTLNQSAFSYYSTGYVPNVEHITGGTGVDGSIFDRVVVTAPNGTTLTLRPRSGFSYLPLVKGSTVTGTNYVRLNSEYANTADASDPALKDTGLFFADRTVFTNDYIATIPAQSVWKFEYFLAGNTGATPNATQNYKTRARALTIPELKTKGLATLSPTDIADVQTFADPVSGQLPIGGDSTITVNYAVPAGVLPPTNLTVFGNYSGGGFNDLLAVGSTARTGSILCSPTGGADLHCTGATGSPYASTARATGVNLFARDAAGREYASFYAMYKLQ